MVRPRVAYTEHPSKDIGDSWARERPDLDPLDYLIPIYLLRIGRVLEKRVDKTWRERFGLSSSELRVLMALRRSGAPYSRRPTDLYRALLVTSGAMTKQVDRLNALGLVSKEQVASDLAGLTICLTPQGMEIADKALTDYTQTSALGSKAMGISRDELAVLLDLTERILAGFEKMPED